jgi:hypothetical protein
MSIYKHEARSRLSISLIKQQIIQFLNVFLQTYDIVIRFSCSLHANTFAFLPSLELQCHTCTSLYSYLNVVRHFLNTSFVLLYEQHSLFPFAQLLLL